MKQRSLSRRIAVAFLGLALFAGGLGGLITLMFVYNTEDQIFDRLLTMEADHFKAAASGEVLPESRLPFTTYYRDDTLPDFLKAPLEAEPGRSEVFGTDGRHYHLRRVELEALAEPVWIVLQVEDYLVVRPVLNEIMLVLVLSLIAMIMVAAVLGLFLARRVTRPLRSLASEVTAVEPDHLPDDWQTRYPADEVGQLADTLRAAFRRINDFIDREQRFTQDASHELRTPVAVIESSAEMLAKAPDADQAAVLIERIRSAALSMHLSVDVLLALAREDDPALRSQRTAVLPIVERVIVNHAFLLEDKPVELSVEVDPDWRIAGDSAALQVLVANLISNAFRYTERGQIRIERDGGDLVITDTGVGIDDGLKATVTEPAVKGETSTGLGLGLSIVERLCQRCGWRFELSSSPHGTTARL
ncbi:MAG: HAMP domain-containing sensor histidine kinase, partial [Pseudomonadota bacterium]